MSTEPNIPPPPQNLYLAEREDFERTADVLRTLQYEANAVVNRLQLSVSLRPENVRSFTEKILEEMPSKQIIADLSMEDRLIMYSHDLYSMAQSPLKLGSVVGHIALAAILLPADSDPNLVIKAQVTAIRRLALDTPFDGAKNQKLQGGRLLVLFELVPFPPDYVEPGLEIDAMGVFLNVRLKDERAKARTEAAKEGWERVVDTMIKQRSLSGELDKLTDEEFEVWEATARALSRHALRLLLPDAHRTTMSLAMVGREGADRAMNTLAPLLRSGDIRVTPLKRGLAVLRLYIEVIIAVNALPSSPESFNDVAAQYFKGSAVSSGLSLLKVFTLFTQTYLEEILDGTRSITSSAGVDVIVLSQILGLSPMDVTNIGRNAFTYVVGERCVRMADDPSVEAKDAPNWKIVLKLLTISPEVWSDVLQDCLSPIVQKRLEEGHPAPSLLDDSGVILAGRYLGFSQDQLEEAVKKQVRESLADLVRELKLEVSDAVRETTWNMGIGKGLDPADLPCVTDDGVQEVLDKVKKLGLSAEDATKIVIQSARDEVKVLCMEVVKLEQERNAKGGAVVLIRALGLGLGFVKPLLEALNGAELSERELAGLLSLRTSISEEQEVSVSEIGWGMRQDPAFEDAGRMIMVLFGIA